MASKGLHTLIKVHKNQLDQLRKEQSSLLNQKDSLLALSEQLQQEVEEEKRLAEEDIELMKAFGPYAARMRKRREEIAKEVAVLDTKLEQVGEFIAVKFEELKRYEIARDNRARREALKAKRVEDKVMDEIGNTMFVRSEKRTPEGD